MSDYLIKSKKNSTNFSEAMEKFVEFPKLCGA